MIVAGGVLAGCAPGCPENLLQVGSAPTLVEVAGKAGVAMTVAIAVGVMVVYVARLRAATRPRRRALMAVAVTSLLFLPVIAASHLAFLLELDPELVETLAWATAFAQLLLPLGFLVALLQAEQFAGKASCASCSSGSPRSRRPKQWRDSVAEALDDPALRLAYREPQSERGVPGGRPAMPWRRRPWKHAPRLGVGRPAKATSRWPRW